MRPLARWSYAARASANALRDWGERYELRLP